CHLLTLSLPDDVDPMPPGITIVHLDVNPWELGKNYPAAVAIQGDPKATLPELGEAVRRLTSKEGHPDAPRRRGAVRAAWESERAELARRAEAEAARVPIQPLTLVHELARRAPANAVIVDESISSAQGVRHFFGCADAKSFFGIRGGGIGWGLPAALGVKLALREGPRAAHRLRRHGAGARRPGGACGEDAGDRPRDRSGVCQRRPVPGRRPHRPRVQVRSLVVAARPAP